MNNITEDEWLQSKDGVVLLSSLLDTTKRIDKKYNMSNKPVSSADRSAYRILEPNILTPRKLKHIGLTLWKIEDTIQALRKTRTVVEEWSAALDEVEKKLEDPSHKYSNCALRYTCTYEDPEVLIFSILEYQKGFIRQVGAEVFASIVRDILGNPFKPPHKPIFSPEAKRLADEAYASASILRVLPNELLLIAADAAEESGAEDEIVQHLRDNSHPHRKGCWAVDFLRGIC